MQEISLQPIMLTLGVAVLTPDPLRREALEAIVVKAGYVVVDLESADVVLAEGEAPSRAIPALMLTARDVGREGWLPANANARQIQTALAAIAAGLEVRPWNTPAAARFEELSEPSTSDLLTPRELEILSEISAGRSNKAIARALGISLHTVKFHIESLLRKLGARTRAEAVAKALERRATNRIDL